MYRYIRTYIYIYICIYIYIYTYREGGFVTRAYNNDMVLNGKAAQISEAVVNIGREVVTCATEGSVSDRGPNHPGLWSERAHSIRAERPSFLHAPSIYMVLTSGPTSKWIGPT